MVGTHTKVTLSLDAKIVEEVQQLVKAGKAASQSAFYEEALRHKLKEIRRQRRREALLAASNDPLFFADIEEIAKDFAYVDVEAARMIK